MDKQRKNRWPLICAVLLTAYAAFTLLDAFVIPRDIVVIEATPRPAPVTEAPPVPTVAPSAAPTASPEPTPEPTPVITENSYRDENISIEIATLREHDTTVYAADVTLSDAAYLRTGLAGGAFGRNLKETTAAIAEANGALLAINGDFYGFRNSGVVLRNGYLYRTEKQSGTGHDDLIVYSDGRFEILDEAEVDAAALAEAGAEQIFCFGPALVKDGEVSVAEGYELEQVMLSNPRTAIGQLGPLHYLFVVSDGRTETEAGLSLYQLAELMRSLGCETAYNLDGGGSSTMWFMGRVVNYPTFGQGYSERSVSDIVYIAG